jgi:alpha-glucosidase
MTNRFKLIVLTGLALCALVVQGKPSERVTSPNGRLVLTASLNGDGQPCYELQRGGETIIQPSTLGFTLRDGDLSRHFKVLAFSRDSKDETWQQPLGEETSVRNHYNELTMRLQQRGGQQRQLNIVFRVFDDGIGFRYEFPRQRQLTDFVITDELTRFAFPFDAKTWAMPTQGTEYYEAIWAADKMSTKPEVSTPITMEVRPDLYMVVHEANLTDYSSLNLKPVGGTKQGGVTMKAELIPWSTGELVFARAPFVSPWRTVIVGSTPGDLMASRLMLNLNEPCKIADTSWLEPGKYVGIWWSMHMRTKTWEQGPRHGATTENTRRYIDFAASHGFKGVLVEGWNVGWDGDWTKNGHLFSFTKPYPDYDLEGLQRYALSKGVRLIAHNETGGAALNYEQQLEEAFALYERMGIKAVKTGYVNVLMDGKENQHSQYGVRHYRKVIECAARHHIMVVNHEPAMPTGLQRTWPNLISGEGVRGQEYNAWSTDGGNPPSHIVTIPFTRQLAGPIDFTPGIFDLRDRAVKGTRPNTTIAKQLAEYVLIYTPWQMAADEIESYEGQAGLAFIEAVPTNWSETRVLDARIGEYLAIARRDRDSDNWFIGGATNETARDMTLRLDFLKPGTTYKAIIYRDGEGADYKTNPYPLAIDQQWVSQGDNIKIHLATSGGFAIMLQKMN